ncbi:MAG TPA: hypothetical protein PK826_01290 [Anaerolineae bacterium]|nr:hypothetical protein [Anaerolineae bacterium]
MQLPFGRVVDGTHDSVERQVLRATGLGPGRDVRALRHELDDVDRHPGDVGLARIVRGVVVEVFVGPQADVDAVDRDVDHQIFAAVEVLDLIAGDPIEFEGHDFTLDGPLALRRVRIIRRHLQVIDALTGHVEDRCGGQNLIAQMHAHQHVDRGGVAIVRGGSVVAG